MSKTVLIVGGTSGIGRELATELAEHDAQVHVLSRGRHETGGRPGISQHICDVSVDSPEFPAIDAPLAGLAYLPGTVTLKPFNLLRDRHFQDDLNVNPFGAIRTIRHHLKNLKAAQGASIVLMSTVAVRKPACHITPRLPAPRGQWRDSHGPWPQSLRPGFGLTRLRRR